MSDLFGNILPSQSSLAFPVSLTERYRPHLIADFVGLEKPRKLAASIAARPFDSSWVFVGASGTGKTTLAMAIAETMPAEIHHIPSQECNLATLERVCYSCHFVPMSGCRRHIILIDEADQMSAAAQLYCLSKLDGTAPILDTIWIFTCNATARFEARFLSRNKVIEFSSYGIAAGAADLLASIWAKESPAGSSAPNFARIVKDANNNIREALQKLEVELMLA
jgi:replication-associated recombination protein RarA